MVDPVNALKAMRLHGMAGCYAEWIEHGNSNALTHYERVLPRFSGHFKEGRGLPPVQ
jgi:hypothetical protein